MKKKPHTFDNRNVDVIETEINLDINGMTSNPSYTIKQNTKQEDQYDYISTSDNEFVPQDVITQHYTVADLNPTPEDSEAATNYDDIIVQSNTLHSSSTSAIEIVEVYENKDEDGYVETNSPNTQPAGYLEIIGPATKEEDSVWEEFKRF